jgi:GT2 family glycosyltransferase
MRAAVPLMLAALWASTDLDLERPGPQALITARISALGQLVWIAYTDMTNVGNDRAPATIERMEEDRQIMAAQPRTVPIQLPIERPAEPDRSRLRRVEVLVRHQIERFEPAPCPSHQPLAPLPARPVRS